MKLTNNGDGTVSVNGRPRHGEVPTRGRARRGGGGEAVMTLTCIDCGISREVTSRDRSDRCNPCAQTRDGKQRRAQTPGAWAESGLCAQVDPEIWFPEKGQHGKVTQARAICRRCPVIGECLDWALETDQEFGIYGGLTRKERLRSIGRKAAA